MATLETIRTRAGVFISVIIGIALLSFIINPDSLQRASMMFSSKYDAGEIAGKSISYQDYQNRVEYNTALFKMSSGEGNLTEQVSEQIREQTWQEFIKKYVIFKEFEKVGIVVSDDELVDLITGKEPVQIIRQIFTDPQTGEFDRARLTNVIQNLDLNPDLKVQWLSIENQIRENQLLTKYSDLLTKSTLFNSIDIKDALSNSANNFEFSYIVQPYALIDTVTKVSEADLKKYYNNHKYLFEQSRSRDIEFVSIPIRPSVEDYRFTMDNMLKIEKDFIVTPVADLGMFVNRNSEKVFDDLYYKKGELPLSVDTFAFSEGIGAFLPIYQEDQIYKMARITDIKNLSDSVRARHILLSPENTNKADSIIDALKKGADFATLANEFSIDQAANQKGGDLNWFTFRTMVRPFSDSCFYNPKGKIMKVRTQFGEHIVQIVDKGKESKHVQVALVQQSVTPGKITSQELFNQANTIATESENKQKRFEELADEKGLYIQTANRVGLNDRKLANYSNARDIIRWAYQAKLGDVSEVFEIDNGYFVVAALTAIREEGIAPFDQVKDEIEVVVKKENQANVIANEIKTDLQSINNIDELATKLSLQVINVTTPVNFLTAYIPGIMIPEPKLVGAVTSAPINSLTGPIKGENGVYVFTVNNKTVNENISLEEEKTRLESMLPTRAYDFYNVLIDKANVVDNRGNFF